jgi:hypothetical protein
MSYQAQNQARRSKQKAVHCENEAGWAVSAKQRFSSDPCPSHDPKPQNTPWANLVCFLIFIQPDPSSLVTIMEYPAGNCRSLIRIYLLSP